MTKTLVWDPSVSQALDSPNISGQEGSEILGDFLYATDLFGSDIDIYAIDPNSGALNFLYSYGTQGAGSGEFGEFGPLDVSFYQLTDGSTKAYTPDAGNFRIAVLDVDVATADLTWDDANTLEDVGHLNAPYGIEINGNFLYTTDWGASNIDIYAIDPATGELSYVRSFGSEGSGINQFSVESPLDISFLKLESGATKAYVPDSQNQRVVVLDVNTETGELTWDAELTLPNGEPSTNQYGIEIHESTLYVNKYDVGVLLYDIDMQTGAVTFNHAVGSAGSGDAQFLTPIDTSFYQAANGNTYAYVTDSENRRITAFTVESDFEVNESNVLKPGLNGESQLTVSLVESQLAEASEVVLITSNSADGSIDGVQMTDAGYLAAAAEQAQIVFSAPDHDSIVSGIDLKRVVTISGDDYLNFAVIKGGTLQDALTSPDSVEVSFGTQILSGGAVAEGQDSGVNDALLRVGLGRFTTAAADAKVSDGIVLSVQLGNQEKPVGSDLQGVGAESELIDLRAETGTLTAEFSVYREADFDNVIGFFAVENEAGQIRNGLGALLSPGEAGYVEAAIRNRIAVELSGEDKTTTSYTAQVEGGQLLSSFISNGPLDLLLDDTAANDPSVYFVHVGANTDGSDHVRLLGDNTFGFEDSVGGGDKDFDDLVVKVDFA